MEEAVLRNVHPGWLALFDRRQLDVAWAKIRGADITPPPMLIFEAFRYCGPDECGICILGQDPYPAPGDAQGLSFSAKSPPKSLKNVFACLQGRGLQRPSTTTGDLRAWAAQGVLLLNTALTTLVGTSGAHLAVWRPFVRDLLSAWAKRRAGRPIHFLLWGREAQAYEPKLAATPPHVLLRWSHPSPCGDATQPLAKRFVNCDHFTLVAAARAEAKLPPIVWDSAEPSLIFCDGACVGMHGGSPRAAYGVVCVGAAYGRTLLSGRVEPCEYELADPARPEFGLTTVAAATAVRPTNNRGEFLAFARALACALRAGFTGPVEICSDSRNTVMTFSTWYPNRLKAGTAHEMMNQDFIKPIWIMYNALRARAPVVLTHHRSHQPCPPASAPARTHVLWHGNRVADQLATRQLESPGGLPVKTTPLACL